MRSPLRVVQVVPKYSAGVCGIGDYAATLCRHWNPQDVEVAIVPLFVGSEIERSQSMTPWIAELDKLRELVLQADWLVLQYEPYGYSTSDPLLAVVKKLLSLAAQGNCRVAVFFHELYDDGPVWRSSFWRGRKQLSATKALASATDLAVTSNATFHARLAPWCKDNTLLPAIPVPSAIGEPSEIVPWRERQEIAVVLGGVAKRSALYAEAELLSAWCKSVGIKKLVDFGPPVAIRFGKINFEVRCHGIAGENTILTALSESRYGLMHLGGRWLAKSSIFATYCASGVVPVVFGMGPCGFDGLSSGREMADGQSTAGFDGEAIVDSAARWYRGHNAAAHAAMLLDAMRAIG